MAKRVLVIAYQFPPVGGAGVQRVAKLAKYLPDFGWQPTVLTVSNPSVPLFDTHLASEVSGVDVRKAKTFEPGYQAKQAVSASVNGQVGGIKSVLRKSVRAAANMILQPDPQILWYPHALKMGRRILREGGFEAVVATGPPFSSFLLARKLGLEFDLPYLLDFRDEWDISNSVWENKRQGRLSLALQRKLQTRVLRDASGVVATTMASSETLAHRCEQAGSSGVNRVVFNGFDAEDMRRSANDGHQSKGERFRLSYVGTLWNLTSIQPLVDAVVSLEQREPESVRHLELVFAGRRTAEQDACLDQLESTSVKLVRHGYMDHGEALQLMESSDALCLTLSDLPHARRVIPAKMFEYMAVKKRIVGIMPQGDAWELLADYPGALLKVPGDVFGIRDGLQTELDYYREFGSQEFDYVNLHQFSRHALTGQFANVLNEISGAEEAVRAPSLTPASIEDQFVETY